MPGVGAPRWKVELLKVRNGLPGAWIVEWVDGRLRCEGVLGAAALDEGVLGEGLAAGGVWREGMGDGAVSLRGGLRDGAVA